MAVRETLDDDQFACYQQRRRDSKMLDRMKLSSRFRFYGGKTGRGKARVLLETEFEGLKDDQRLWALVRKLAIELNASARVMADHVDKSTSKKRGKPARAINSFTYGRVVRRMSIEIDVAGWSPPDVRACANELNALVEASKILSAATVHVI
jgi:hypothetical protein